MSRWNKAVARRNADRLPPAWAVTGNSTLEMGALPFSTAHPSASFAINHHPSARLLAPCRRLPETPQQTLLTLPTQLPSLPASSQMGPTSSRVLPRQRLVQVHISRPATIPPLSGIQGH